MRVMMRLIFGDTNHGMLKALPHSEYITSALPEDNGVGKAGDMMGAAFRSVDGARQAAVNAGNGRFIGDSTGKQIATSG